MKTDKKLEEKNNFFIFTPWGRSFGLTLWGLGGTKRMLPDSLIIRLLFLSLYVLVQGTHTVEEGRFEE